MNPQDTARILNAVAADFIPENINLLPQIAAQFERRSFRQTLRSRPVLVILLVILALGLISGAVVAVGRALGYLPGIGFVEQGALIRVLKAPVSQTRDGITLNVEHAYLTNDLTMITYSVEGIPPEARPKGEGGISCHGAAPELLLPDGSKYSSKDGKGNGWERGYRTSLRYDPIPAAISSITFHLSCLEDVAPNAAPQDWEFTLPLIPSSPDLKVVPVIVVATPVPTIAPTSMPASIAQSDAFLGIGYHLEAIRRTDRGFILDTSIRWQGPSDPEYVVGTGAEVSLVDNGGKSVPILATRDENRLPAGPSQQTTLSFSLEDGVSAEPLTLSLPWVSVNLPTQNRPQFQFDPGSNPQPGQTWMVNQTLNVLGQHIKIISARYVTRSDLKDQPGMRFLPEDISGFEFTMEADLAIRAIPLTVDSGFTPEGGGFSGQPFERNEAGQLKTAALLTGKMNAPLVISVPYIQIQHSWQIRFDLPEQAHATPTQTGETLNVSLQIEKVIPLEDGYYVLGRTQWNDTRLKDLGFSGWDSRLIAPDGSKIPLEPVYSSETGIKITEPNQWVYRVYGKRLPSPLTLHLTKALLQLAQPYTFTVDPGASPKVGQEWTIQKTFDILGHLVTIQSARFMTQGESRGFEIDVLTDSQIAFLGLNIEGGVTGGTGGGSGASPNDGQGHMKLYALSNGQFTGKPVLLTIRGVSLMGNWQTSWTPPAAGPENASEQTLAACGTRTAWQQALEAADPAAVPVGLPKALVYRGTLLSNTSTSILDLNGSNEKQLVYGAPISLTPHKGLIYYNPEGQIFSYDLSSSQSRPVGQRAIIWSPDEQHYAYFPAKPSNLTVVNADGTILRTIGLVGKIQTFIQWTSDGMKILYSEPEDGKEQVNLIDIRTGEIQRIIQWQGKNGVQISLSPDNNWMAYTAHVPGKYADGIFISRLDGTGKRLLIQLDDMTVFKSLWSPDGKWLMVSTLQQGFSSQTSIPTLINIENCRMFPLPWLNGDVRFWVQP